MNHSADKWFCHYKYYRGSWYEFCLSCYNQVALGYLWSKL